MSSRSIIMVLSLLILMFAVGNIVSNAAEEYSEEELILIMDDEFALNRYEAIAEGNLSLCRERKYCVEEVGVIQSWICFDEVCDATNSTKNLLDCLDKGPIDGELKGDLNLMAPIMCALIKSPSPETRKDFLHSFSGSHVTEDALVEMGAYLMALKDSREACANYLESYLGPYSPGLDDHWYSTIAGCSILSREMTREEVEIDLSYWLSDGFCPNLIDPGLRQACFGLKGSWTATPEDFY